MEIRIGDTTYIIETDNAYGVGMKGKNSNFHMELKDKTQKEVQEAFDNFIKEDGTFNGEHNGTE